MKPAETQRGLCACCAVHWWLFSVDGLRWSLSADGPALLGLATVRLLLAPVLNKQHPELGAVDWEQLISQWYLPWPAEYSLPTDRNEAHV